jgi:hypothetical protein
MELNKKSKIPSDTTTIAEEKSIYQTDTNVDSGCISGPIDSAGDFDIEDSKSSLNIVNKESHQTLNSSSETRKEQCEQQQEEYKDSGLIEDYSSESIEVLPSPATTSTAPTDMILLGGPVDPNFSEWFCGLSLEGNQPVNNLNIRSRESPKTVRTPARWEIYYQQNEEGDT